MAKSWPRLPCVILATAALGFLGPDSLGAQVPVEGPEGPIGQPTRGSEAPRSAPKKGLPRYSLWARAQESWERNSLLRADGQDQTSLVDSLAAGAGYTFRGPRGDLGVNGEVSRLNYHDLPSLNRTAYGVGAQGTYNFSRRSSLSVREQYAVSAFNPASELITSGLPVSLVRSKTNRATADLRLGFSARTTAALAVRQETLRFTSEGRAQGLVNGSVVSFEPTLSQRLGTTDSVNVGYSYQKNLETSVGTDIQSIFAGWSRRLSREWGSALSAGVSHVASTDRTPTRWSPYGSVRLNGEFRKGTLEARYTHSVSQAFGLGGERVADLGSVAFTRPLGRKFTASGNLSYGRSRDLNAPANVPNDASRLDFTTRSAGGSLRYLLSKKFELNAGYEYADNDPAGVTPRFKNERGTVSLTYGRVRE